MNHHDIYVSLFIRLIRKKNYPDISIDDECLEVDELRKKRISLDIRGKESTDL